MYENFNFDFVLLTIIWKIVHLWRDIVNPYIPSDKNIQTVTSTIAGKLVFNVSNGQFNLNRLRLTYYHLLPAHDLLFTYTSISCYKQVDTEDTHGRDVNLWVSFGLSASTLPLLRQPSVIFFRTECLPRYQSTLQLHLVCFPCFALLCFALLCFAFF